MSLFKKKSRIILEKGETLGGTAPLLLLDQVVAGKARKGTLRKKEADGNEASSTILVVVSLVFIVALLVAGIQLIDWSFVTDILEKLGFSGL